MDRYLKRFLEALDAIQLRYLVLGAVGSLFGFATLYYVGSFHGWGLKDTNNGYISFGSCLYFSVVTFTSLGFGDLVPLNTGRLLAAIEVIFGLTVFGWPSQSCHHTSSHTYSINCMRAMFKAN